MGDLIRAFAMEHTLRKARTFAIPALLALFAFAGTATAALVSMDFEGLSGGHSAALVSDGFVLDPGRRDWTPDALPYVEGGPWVGHYHIAEPADSTWTANNGTKYFAWDYFIDDSILNIFQTSGDVFGVEQFDLSEAAYGLGTACLNPPHPQDIFHSGVTFTGHLAGGGTITRRENFDMVCDGAGPAVDFQTFAFDGQWKRLTAFSIVPDYSHMNPGLDNLVLSRVPVPSTLGLVAFGLVGLVPVFRRSGRGQGDKLVRSR